MFGEDRIIITDITNSINLTETKTINLENFTNYLITSSNIENTFKTGSYLGNFYGVFTGASDSSSLSITSSNSLSTNNLISSSQNGTSSYSINSFSCSKVDYSSFSISSSFSDRSRSSDTSSYVFYNSITDISNTSNESIIAESSSLSKKTKFVNVHSDSGIVFHSKFSNKSIISDFAERLRDTNTTIVQNSYISDNSDHSTKSSLSNEALYSYTTFNSKVILIENYDVFAYCSFKLDSSLNIIPLTWNNVSRIEFIKKSSDHGGSRFLIKYNKAVPETKTVLVKADCAPMSSNLPDAYINWQHNLDLIGTGVSQRINVTCWGTSCSNSSGIINVHGIKYGTTKWSGGAWKKKRYLKCDLANPVDSYLVQNCIFSFIAFAIPANISGSSDEAPPTTISVKC